MIRWTLSDGVTTYTFFRNPKEMSSPYPTWTRSSSPSGIRPDRPMGRQQNPSATEWSFKGRCYSQQQYDDLLLWCSKDEPLTLTDHLARSFTVIIAGFSPTDRRSRDLVKWDYEIRTFILEYL